ncbi:Glutamyl-tRNA(Gln) amidotransferase subunit A, mitochondrial [Caenorhabditis elegans]|uniref:Glutamyl-tRNA(Gln) amidotransferase subunit A, mitochondrial n=3 Tax=Caenorhabditis elegans TaxID=6239 RepID=Q95Y25_CAEEL|nr:Glutamyl-tRNA(Gln) amidotransferase subunit A, mitochondrial [Caenorhabditis elegans]CCD72814.1 Glutamyl-tRNA(Gln) amidotransferase subunit A, mitochondrial [Caenorhabditis elegans]|eukprot:NP_500129.1 Glutamyl-tRNA(Gln) amidotransferase subunit A, mitochondrial [Caenorhabditis elegans]
MHRIESSIEKAVKYRSHGIFITETFELARQQAKNALKNGLNPFPIAVKDCFLTNGTSTTCASQMLEKYTPPVNATIVERIVARGGCIIGKTNLDEFCMGTSSALGHFGPVKSDLTEPGGTEDWTIPGGSSGGSAVAVQTGIADFALGSDTGGSTRNPAAFNGIFGFKPTYGVLSRNGLIPLVNSLDAPSIFAKTAQKCWELLELSKGIDKNDSTSVELPEKAGISSLEGLKIGIPVEYHNECLTEDAWRHWNRVTGLLKSRGAAEIHVLNLPTTRFSLACYSVIAAADVASNMARYDSVAYGHRSSSDSSTYEMYASSRSEALNTIVRRRIFAGNYFLMKQYRQKYFERALKVRRIIHDELRQAFREVDLIVTPTASGTAPKYSELRDTLFSKEDNDDYFTQAANLAGIPSISVPVGVAEDGLPIGVQLMADKLQDRAVCDVAHILDGLIRK